MNIDTDCTLPSILGNQVQGKHYILPDVFISLTINNKASHDGGLFFVTVNKYWGRWL
jgi:hypothetical protein